MNYTSTIEKNGIGKDEIYTSNNPLIKWLAKRFLLRIREYLTLIDAFNASGLDVGVGEGDMLNYLFQRRIIKNIEAIDLDKYRIQEAKKRYPYFKFQLADVYEIDQIYETGKFEFVLATEIIEHLTNPDIALKKLIQIVKPGAYFIISVPFEPFFRWGNVIRGKYWDKGGRTPAHVNFWNKTQFRIFLSQYFEIIQISGWSSFPWIIVLAKVPDQ